MRIDHFRYWSIFSTRLPYSGMASGQTNAPGDTPISIADKTNKGSYGL